MLGSSVASLGDVNGDNISDVIIGSPGANYNSGSAAVIFGSNHKFPSEFDLSNLNGKNGFIIEGTLQNSVGEPVGSAGDINGDGLNDIVLGSKLSGYQNSGHSYIIYGSKNAFPASLNVENFNGSNGFTITGQPNDSIGSSVSFAGDFNADGIDDFLIGGSNANHKAGRCYVIFGSKGGFPSQFSVVSLDGSIGFTIEGVHPGDQVGSAVSPAGDFNADGVSDIIVGASGAGAAGQSYVIFGSKYQFPPSINSTWINGQNGFVAEGWGRSFIGTSQSGVGDINNDGADDVIIGAPNAMANTGQSYVVLGGHQYTFQNPLDLSLLNGMDGFTINGVSSLDLSGSSVSSAGDINGDGIADMVIGAPHVNVLGDSDVGHAYFIFGEA